ncbi:MAG: fumarylacetoacetate hydrolase family protein [Caldimicrobium sp.]|nr:fumarylacetoacetate hydrolase family protein [Caldimicrobium sp.]MCX7873544.1 fumarylacetoacetate hydrolase family protein [Caldimicrobium sp.]MDW8094071.1 fumarylacetoacetate hydrolase family protein [Caldimicrobium sp.]
MTYPIKIGRFKRGEEVFYGYLLGEEVVCIDGTSKERMFLRDIKILAPCIPTKIIGVGLNYRDHAEELKMALPQEPLIFLKPPTAVIGPEESIVLPPESKEVHYEGELAVVIGQKLYRPYTYDEVEKAILGYTCFNDVTARDLQRRDIQWTRSKSFNTFAPIGPFIVKGIDPQNLRIETRLNGKIVQSSHTKQMIFKPIELIFYISQIMTLLPGDVIATGTPSGVGPLKAGDVVEVEIEHIGVLRNSVESLEGERL